MSSHEPVRSTRGKPPLRRPLHRERRRAMLEGNAGREPSGAANSGLSRLVSSRLSGRELSGVASNVNAAATEPASGATPSSPIADWALPALSCGTEAFCRARPRSFSVILEEDELALIEHRRQSLRRHSSLASSSMQIPELDEAASQFASDYQMLPQFGSPVDSAMRRLQAKLATGALLSARERTAFNSLKALEPPACGGVAGAPTTRPTTVGGSTAGRGCASSGGGGSPPRRNQTISPDLSRGGRSALHSSTNTPFTTSAHAQKRRRPPASPTVGSSKSHTWSGHFVFEHSWAAAAGRHNFNPECEVTSSPPRGKVRPLGTGAVSPGPSWVGRSAIAASDWPSALGSRPDPRRIPELEGGQAAPAPAFSDAFHVAGGASGDHLARSTPWPVLQALDFMDPDTPIKRVTDRFVKSRLAEIRQLRRAHREGR